ncbi:hypothetical protein SPBR_01792 [Sporothrix brasiliensis 5110]|uniref:Secretory lipase n=1 Tax=Sporothrix brasiliensis 5110 TaxID=1398154 RepID=A0A0C2IWM1_9PEZI|nr:uncharacterized protein SPBR_01792 [Sporothrix brasiliensis 5110]KIH91125.1 hypothetical protein SPBR_01792 [Sporothrix brasiliensis 5110]
MVRRISPARAGALALGLAAALFAPPTLAQDAPPACPAPLPVGPSSTAFYTPPDSLPDSDHGSVVWYRGYTDGVSAIAGGTNILVLYTQEGVHGNTVATSGSIVIPDGDAPHGGWPVVTWAHGTTGIADQCAPTINDPPSDADTRDKLLGGWVRKGYAVVRTDYEGLGTPGDHPYLIGPSEGRAVLDIVRAARQFDARISARVVIAGHSQGGHAALWAASLAPAYTPELDVRATIAFAPANSLESEVPLLDAVGNTTALSGTVALIVRGLSIANASLDVVDIMTPDAAALYPQTLTACSAALDDPTSFGGLGANDLVQAHARLADVLAQLKDNDPTYLTGIPQPVLVLQGSADTTVFPFTTAAMVKNLKAGGVDIVEQVYTGATHMTVIDAAMANATDYLVSVLSP